MAHEEPLIDSTDAPAQAAGCKWRPLLRIAKIFFVWSAIRFVLASATTLPISSVEHVATVLVCWCTGLILFVAAFAAALDLFNRPTSRRWARIVLWMGPCPLLQWATAALDSPSRAMRIATPIVLAIESYTAREGHPPASLEGLAPTHLVKTPAQITRTFKLWYRAIPEEAFWDLRISGGALLLWDECTYSSRPHRDRSTIGVVPISEWVCSHSS